MYCVHTPLFITFCSIQAASSCVRYQDYPRQQPAAMSAAPRPQPTGSSSAAARGPSLIQDPAHEPGATGLLGPDPQNQLATGMLVTTPAVTSAEYLNEAPDEPGLVDVPAYKAARGATAGEGCAAAAAGVGCCHWHPPPPATHYTSTVMVKPNKAASSVSFLGIRQQASWHSLGCTAPCPFHAALRFNTLPPSNSTPPSTSPPLQNSPLRQQHHSGVPQPSEAAGGGRPRGTPPPGHHQRHQRR